MRKITDIREFEQADKQLKEFEVLVKHPHISKNKLVALLKLSSHKSEIRLKNELDILIELGYITRDFNNELNSTEIMLLNPTELMVNYVNELREAISEFNNKGVRVTYE